MASMLNWERTWQVLSLILLLGGALRFYQLGENSFVADEFLDINSAYGYHQTGQWQAWDFNFGVPSTVNQNEARDERAAPYKWQVAALFSLLPPTEMVARSVSVAWGIFAILVVFWSAWIFTARRDISLVAALLCAVSISAIVFSRRLRMYAMFFPLYLAAATSLYAAYEMTYTGKIKLLRDVSARYGIHLFYLFFGLGLAAISLWVHQLSVHLAISFGGYVLIRAAERYRQSGEWKNKYGLSLLLGALAILVTAFLLPSVIRTFLQGLVFFDDHFGYLDLALNDFSTPLIGALLIALGCWTLFRVGENRVAALYLFTAYFIPLLMAIFLWRRNVGPQYIFFLQSFGMIFAAAGIMKLAEAIKRLMVGERNKWRSRISLGLVLLVVLNVGYFFAENNTYHETSTGGNPNYRKVFAYVKKEKRETDVLITRNFRNYYWNGANMPVFDFGGELSRKKLSLDDIQQIQTTHSSGWFVYSGNDEDYISSEVEQYVARNWERVSNANVRGDITVYRWQ